MHVSASPHACVVLQVRAARPEHPELPKQLARLYYRTGQHAKAVSALREFTASHPDATDLTHINLLAELLCSPEVADWRGVLTLLDSTRQELLAEGEEVPVDLRVKAAVATAHLGDIQTAVTELAPLLAEPVETFGDLYHDAAAAMEALGQHEAAEPFLRALADDPGAGPEVWRRLAHCCKAAGRPGGAVAVWEQYTSRESLSRAGSRASAFCIVIVPSLGGAVWFGETQVSFCR